MHTEPTLSNLTSKIVAFWIGLLFFSFNAQVNAAPILMIAAAADLAPCMAALNLAFVEHEGKVEIKTSIGASGSFFAQIQNGAPFDLFLSADQDYPQRLIELGLADAASKTLYARGQLLLFSSDATLNLSKGWELLRDPKITHIAIANPITAPYGRAAQAALQQAGLWDAIHKKIIFGENITQTTQFITTGHAQLGLVSATVVKALNNRANTWLIPTTLYPPILQAGVVTQRGHNNPYAFKYLQFLRSPQGQAILRNHGFELP